MAADASTTSDRETQRRLELGVNVTPDAADLATVREVAVRADALGLDLFGIQDHPYQRRFLETWTLIADLLARTERIRIFPDVANLPLRLPTMIAKQAASLDVLSGGRFELGIGAGAFWEAIGAMGGPVRSAGESVEALEEAVAIIRRFWSGERTIRYDGRHYSVRGLHPGPAPTHPIEIWVGAYRPRMLELTGRVGDGWLPSLPYAPPERVPELTRRIEDAAAQAGREPGEIRRLYNLSGRITDGPASELLRGPPEHWIAELSRFSRELGFDTLLFWPDEEPGPQLERFAAEVVPGLREALAQPHPAR